MDSLCRSLLAAPPRDYTRCRGLVRICCCTDHQLCGAVHPERGLWGSASSSKHLLAFSLHISSDTSDCLHLGWLLIRLGRLRIFLCPRDREEIFGRTRFRKSRSLNCDHGSFGADV